VGPNRNHERGGGKVNLLLTVLVVGALIFAAIKIVPAYVNNYQLQDSMETEARFAGANRKAEADIRQDVWKKVEELGIPAKQDDLRVSMAEGAVQISLSYTIPIDLQVYRFNLDFHPHADNRTI
jgi:Domain of unknown function (DUF4845)